MSPFGHWRGEILVMGSRLEITVELSPHGEGLAGTIEIPAQRAEGVPLSNVWFAAGRIGFELAAGPGVARFEGDVREGQIAGTFSQAGVVGDFRLARGKSAYGEAPPGAPSPRSGEEEVRFESQGAVLAGTLSLPSRGGPHPAVALVSGSGQHGRDQEVAGFRMFRVLADRLVHLGLAVLRWDDRGIGSSTGESLWHLTPDDAAADVRAAVRFLAEHASIDPGRIGLCGFSEGALIAARAAAITPEVRSIALLAPPAIPARRLLPLQEELLQKAAGRGAKEVAEAVARRERMLDLAVRGDTGGLRALLLDEARGELDHLPEERRSAVAGPQQLITSLAEQRLHMLLSSWFRALLVDDPARHLGRLTIPVLALFGGRDLQVPAERNAEALASVLRTGDVTIRIFPDAGHLFLPARTGAVAEYGAAGREFVEGFTETLGGWLLSRSAIPPSPAPATAG